MMEQRRKKQPFPAERGDLHPRRQARWAGLLLAACLLPLIPASVAADSATVWLLKTDPTLFQALNGKPSASISKQGVTATLSASVGVLHHSKTGGFGVDAPTQDDPDGIDKGEYIDLVFDRDLYFSAFSVSSFSQKNGDVGIIKLKNTEMFVIRKTGYQKVEPFLIPAGWVLRIEGVEGAGKDTPNGWSFSSFSTYLP